VGIRAVPVGEAIVACVLADAFLRHRGQVERKLEGVVRSRSALDARAKMPRKGGKPAV
jgi:chorismate synthase